MKELIMTVDVEDYFQVGAFFDCVKKENWDSYPIRAVDSTLKLLELFEKHNIKSTFFVLGWLAERHPYIIERISELGHEVASHGYGHDRVCEMNQREFEVDVKRSKDIIESILGRSIFGYRAPCFSINEKTPWAFETLKKLGFTYSSSIYPISHDHYGSPNCPRQPYIDEKTHLVEIPQSTITISGRNYPAGGGGYFRLFPMFINQWLIKTYQAQLDTPYVFYCHPWEVDPEQPRIANASLKSKFRHYVNQNRMFDKIEQLIKSNPGQWMTMDTLAKRVLDKVGKQ